MLVAHTYTHTHASTHARTHTCAPLMLIISAFRGGPPGGAGDEGVILALKGPMIGSDWDNDLHYCHYSVK